MSRLLLVRHGETELNSSQRYWGRTDVPLGEAGIRQAEWLRERLRGERMDCAYSSKLKRALVTAQIIASNHNIVVTVCPELGEIDFGEIEGLTFGEVGHLYPEVARMWIERDPGLTYPGGESLVSLDERVRWFASRLEKHGDDETMLIVAHSGVLRTLVCHLLGLELKYLWQMKLDLASLTIVETYPKFAVLSLLNDVSHLR